MTPSIYLIIHNVRSSYNVGAMLRSADAFAVDKVYMTGYTPFPSFDNDKRLPHIAQKVSRRIHKSALGAEDSVSWSHEPDILKLLATLRAKDIVIAALEQTKSASPLPSFLAGEKIALIVGREVEGIESEVLAAADIHLQIPMLGKKESLNVASTAAIALYQIRYRLSAMDSAA